MDGSRGHIIGASNMNVTIDLVIFDDGEMAGPNETHYECKSKAARSQQPNWADKCAALSPTDTIQKSS